MRKREHIPYGFSLLELLVAMTILLILMATVFPLMIGGQRSYQAQEANADAIANARFAVDRISELIRNAGYDPRRVRFPAVTLGAGGTSITLQSDLNGDGDTADTLVVQDIVAAPESLTISLNGSDVVLTDLAQNPPLVTPIAQNIQAVTFAQPSSRVVTVTVTAFAPVPATPGVRRVTLSQTLFLRNAR